MCIAEWNLVYDDEGFWIYSKENRLQLGNIAITEEEHRAKKYIWNLVSRRKSDKVVI